MEDDRIRLLVDSDSGSKMSPSQVLGGQPNGNNMDLG